MQHILLPKKISQPFNCMNNPCKSFIIIKKWKATTHINTISEKEIKKAAKITNIALSKQKIVENTPENSAVEPEKLCIQLDSSKVTSYKRWLWDYRSSKNEWCCIFGVIIFIGDGFG